MNYAIAFAFAINISIIRSSCRVWRSYIAMVAILTGAFPHSSGYTAKDKLLIKFEQGCESAGKTIACSERNV